MLKFIIKTTQVYIMYFAIIHCYIRYMYVLFVKRNNFITIHSLTSATTLGSRKSECK